MMSNLDKDIEILEKKKKSLNLHIDSYYKNDCETAICRELVKERDAIENVLLRLEGWEEVYNLINESATRIDNTPTSSTLEVDLNKLFTHRYKVDLDSDKSELETYKKIAKERIKSDLRVFAYCLNELELEQRAEELIEKLRKEVENELQS